MSKPEFCLWLSFNYCTALLIETGILSEYLHLKDAIQMKSEIKERYLNVRLTKKQLEILETRAREHDLNGACEYIRFQLFTNKSILEKLEDIEQKLRDLYERLQ